MSQQAESNSVKPTGDLTGAASARFHEQLAEASQSGSPTVLVDLIRPSVMDGRALAALLMARKSVEASGRTLLVRPGHSEYRELETVTGLNDIITE